VLLVFEEDERATKNISSASPWLTPWPRTFFSVFPASHSKPSTLARRAARSSID
jgi:hypothetical protein